MLRSSTLFLLSLCFVTLNLHSQNDVTVNKKGLYGIYDSKKKWVLPATYNSLKYLPINEKSYSIYLLGTDKNGSVLIETKGFKKISPAYENIEIIDASKKLFIIKDKNLEYFYEIGKGILTSYDSFDEHKKFGHNDKVLLLKKGTKSCVFNLKDNSTSIYFEGELIQDFDYKQFLIKDGNKYGVVGNEGETVIPKEFDSLIHISNSEACNKYIAAKKNSKWGIITSSAEIIIPVDYENIDLNIIHNLSRSIDSCVNIFPVKINGKWSVVNDKNKIIITPEYDSIIDYLHPLKFIVLKEGKRGIIDIKGNVLFPFNYKYFEGTDNQHLNLPKEKYYFVNNTCTICNPYETESGWGLADSTGKLLLEMNASIIPLRNYNKYEYENFDSTNYGFLWNIGGKKIKTFSELEEHQTENYDELGNPYIYSVYDSIFFNNIVGGKTGIISNNGKIILPISYEDLRLPLYMVRGGEPFKVNDIYSLNQKHHAYENYDYVINSEGDIFVKENRKWGILSLQSKEILPSIFDSIQDNSINRYDICEVSDSLQKTLNFPLDQLKCFKDGNIYFYTKSGKFLTKLIQKEKIVGQLNFVLNAPNKNNFYFTPLFSLIAVDAIPEYYSITEQREEESVDNVGNFYLANYSIVSNYYAPTSTKLNFLNPLNSSYLFPELLEDFIVLTTRNDDKLRPVQWSKPETKIQLISGNYSSYPVIAKLEAKQYKGLPPDGSEQRFGRFDSILFVKQNSKWFLRNLNEQYYKNKIGFDSVTVNPNNTFIAYTNGSFATYNFNVTEFNKTKIDVTFPEYGSHKLACSSCEYSYIEKKMKSPQIKYDAEGNEIQGDTLISNIKIPFITKGKLNFTDSYCTPLLEKWVDEILFPTPSYANNCINLSDKNDSLFNQSFVYDFELSSIYDAKTIAYRIDKDWYLIAITEPSIIEGPFETIKRNEYFWEATKSGVTKRLKVYDLTEK